jgi:hypothetical protein
MDLCPHDQKLIWGLDRCRNLFIIRGLNDPALKEVSMIRRAFCISALILLLSACAETITPMQQELSSKTMPVYDGRFSSLQAPIHLEYRPAAVKLAGQFGIYKNVRDKDELFSGDLHGRLRVVPAGDSLFWEFRVEGAALGDEKVGSGNSPLIEFRARRDKQGATKDFEIAPVGMKISSPEDKRLFEQIRLLVVSQFRSFSAMLPAAPVQEGSLLLETDMSAALQAYENLWGAPQCSPPQEKIGYAVRGLGSFKGRKVIVAVMEEDFVCTSRKERRYGFSLHGYALLDTETGQILEHHVLTTVKPFYSFDSTEVRMLQKVSAEILE